MSQMKYPETASLIRSARLRKGLSQERAAAQVGCSRLQFIRWEQGIHRPINLRPQLAQVLGIDPATIAEADDDEEAAQVDELLLNAAKAFAKALEAAKAAA